MGMSAPAVKAALVETLRSFFEGDPDVVVSYGLPGQYQPRTVIAVLDQVVRIERPTAGGSQRSREDDLQTEVRVSVYEDGDETVQQVVTEAAWDTANLIAEYLRTRGQETLGQVCREAWVSEAESAEAALREDEIVSGRSCEIRLIVSSRTRY